MSVKPAARRNRGDLGWHRGQLTQVHPARGSRRFVRGPV